MTKLSEAMLEVAKIITHVRTGTTTAYGTTTTMIDNTMTEPDDYWNGGYLWTMGLYDKEGVTPTDYVRSTGTVTFTPALLTSWASNMPYAIMGREYTRSQLVTAINQALADLGAYLVEIAYLTTVENQCDYNLPVSVTDVISVEIAQNTQEPYDYYEYYWWDEIHTTSQSILRLDYDHLPMPGYKIRIAYKLRPSALSVDYASLPPGVPLERIKWTAAIYALRARYLDVGKEDPQIVQIYNECKVQEAAARKFPLPKVTRTPRLSGWL